MDKRLEENTRVKNQMAKAYIKLLSEADPGRVGDIPISQITSRAKVSRMAFYRNFSSKVDLLEYYLYGLIWSDLTSAFKDEIELWSLEYGERFFEIMQKYRNEILILDRCGFSGLILKAFNRINEEIAGDMPSNSIERYRLYIAAGACFNVIMVWLKNGCREPSVELAQRVAEWLGVSRLQE